MICPRCGGSHCYWRKVRAVPSGLVVACPRLCEVIVSGETVLWIGLLSREAGRVTSAQTLKSRSAVGGTLMSRGASAPYRKPPVEVTN